MRPIGILYEHPEWFKPLFAELERRAAPYEAIPASAHGFDPGEDAPRHSLLVNRMSPSAWTRGHGHAVFHTLHFLEYLEDAGANVVNGVAAYRTELSKARQ